MSTLQVHLAQVGLAQSDSHAIIRFAPFTTSNYSVPTSNILGGR